MSSRPPLTRAKHGLGLAGPLAWPFILLALKPVRSPELVASPDLPCLFLPPKPNLASFFARLLLPARPPWSSRDRLPGLLSSLSTATSKRSASVVPTSPPFSARSLGYLDLLSELLKVAQLPGLGRGLLVGGLLDQLVLDLLHVAVVLDHLGEVVLWAGEGGALGPQGRPRPLGRLERLGVQLQLPVQVVRDVLDLGGRGLRRQHRLVRHERHARVLGYRDALERREQRRLVVDGQPGLDVEVLAVVLGHVLEVREGDVRVLVVFLFIIIILLLVIAVLLLLLIFLLLGRGLFGLCLALFEDGLFGPYYFLLHVDL
ncbi:hypothetical protein VP1G_10963 [Cytospora mali]|uniref:Uncharacterized protein n=1 Tax=Cytospora mali TaxID=578113 RepID=A0A194V210_CYTMA|nr:hypothetical protein VP1G_10963 [Valsa mali var. pyri (nom. inval.)]